MIDRECEALHHAMRLVYGAEPHAPGTCALCDVWVREVRPALEAENRGRHSRTLTPVRGAPS